MPLDVRPGQRFQTVLGPHRGQDVEIVQVRSNSVTFKSASHIRYNMARGKHNQRLDVFLAGHRIITRP